MRSIFLSFILEFKKTHLYTPNPHSQLPPSDKAQLSLARRNGNGTQC